ncbi:hypothetical protein CKK33_12155 [Mucilaginibacter sp. MD40]|nr:hypothetical protein CKK33_12155 [Mucilaginibacter sp. MD40]
MTDQFVGTYTMPIVCYLAEAAISYPAKPELIPALASMVALMFADTDLPFLPMESRHCHRSVQH